MVRDHSPSPLYPYAVCLVSALLVFTLTFACSPAANDESPADEARENAVHEPASEAPMAKAEPAELLAAPDELPPCPEPPVDCETEDCSNYPFHLTACQPTEYGPQAADVVESPTNMLYCSGGTYALCFFSGPPQATGNDPSQNVPLPCIVEEGEHGAPIANCTCKAFTSGVYYVDINSILNRGVYLQTINQCGSDGKGCPNAVSCSKDGADCDSRQQAPVCGYLNAQNAADPEASFFPGADLISAFSMAMSDDYSIPTDPPACNGLYAGCMTAPCYAQDGSSGTISDNDLVQCSCPLFDGDFQIGQAAPRQCEPEGGPDDPNRYVWSASNSVVQMP